MLVLEPLFLALSITVCASDLVREPQLVSICVFATMPRFAFMDGVATTDSSFMTCDASILTRDLASTFLSTISLSMPVLRYDMITRVDYFLCVSCVLAIFESYFYQLSLYL